MNNYSINQKRVDIAITQLITNVGAFYHSKSCYPPFNFLKEWNLHLESNVGAGVNSTAKNLVRFDIGLKNNNYYCMKYSRINLL